jgi:hypothetical protein
MPLTPVPNVGSQIDRAIRAYFIANGAGTADDIYTENDWRDRAFPNTTISARQSTEDAVNSRIEAYHVKIQCQWSAAGQPDDPNPESMRIAVDDRIGMIMAALSQTNDNEDFLATAQAITAAGRLLATTGTTQSMANNADMAAFTCSHIHFLGSKRGDPNVEGIAFLEERNFMVHACPFATY